MTKRCRHELETKNGYPNDFICHKCQTIWTLTDYLKWSVAELRTLPIEIRKAITNVKILNALDDYARDLKHVNEPTAFEKYMECRDAALNSILRAIEK
jgi:hypothetical protein